MHGALGGTLALGLAGGTGRSGFMTPGIWQEWQELWRSMQALAAKRGWKVAPLRIGLPASEAEVSALEAKHGRRVPPQLREILTSYAGRVEFGWHVPSHLMPLEKVHLPYTGGIRHLLWDMSHIDEHAIPNFRGWREQISHDDLSEAPNRPEMWEHQFPFADLPNGDMLTIDVSGRAEPHPVRYFSHELEGIHGIAIAPDFVTFISEYSRLGCAGSEQNEWYPLLGEEVGDRHYLSSKSAGAQKWQAWLDKDPATHGPDEPPPVIMATTPADRALLEAAKLGSIAAVDAALAAGARIDCVAEGNWSDAFVTAVIHAIRRGDTAMLQHLADRGASLNTRRLALAEAAEHASADMVRWLIARGARVDGWADERHWPLHILITRRPRSQSAPGGEPAQMAILKALLGAGAKPDAPWDNGITMLMEAGPEASEILLAHGADPNRRDIHGQTALHYVDKADKIRLLIAHGARINAISEPPPSEPYFKAVTPLQRLLQWGRLVGRVGGPRPAGLLEAMLEAGADPKVRDGEGRNTLWFCHSIEDFERMRAFGLDPKETDANGNTLLHRLGYNIRIAHPQAIAFFKHMLGQGIGINAGNKNGQTILHMLARSAISTDDDVRLALDSGADKTIRDKFGRSAHDMTPRAKPEVAALLK